MISATSQDGIIENMFIFPLETAKNQNKYMKQQLLRHWASQQRKTVVEKQETKEVSPVIAPACCTKSLQATVPERGTKASSVEIVESLRAERCTEETCRGSSSRTQLRNSDQYMHMWKLSKASERKCKRMRGNSAWKSHSAGSSVSSQQPEWKTS